MSNPDNIQLTQLLTQVQNTLDKYGVLFWLDCGTLLGLVRDGCFIDWDDDIDLGTWEHDVSKELKDKIGNDLLRKGYYVITYDTYMNISNKNVKADIKFYRKVNGFAVEPKYLPKNIFSKILHVLSVLLVTTKKYNISTPHYYFIQRIFLIIPRIIKNILSKYFRYLSIKVGSINITESVPVKYFNDFEILTFSGMEFNIPKDYKNYLKYRYGSNWIIPDSDWITERDDKSVHNKLQ